VTKKPSVKPVKITVGLPIHNEEGTLNQFLLALEESVKALPPHVVVETIACLNGSTDKSAEIVQKAAKTSLGKKIGLSVAHSEKGKLNAQLEIVRNRTHDGPLCFMDTDTVPAKNTLSALLETLENDKGCYVSFARIEPFYSQQARNTLTPFQHALCNKYASRSTSRKYIHGRAFMLRDDKELRHLQDDIPERAAKVEGIVSDRLNLRAGPLIDDIYLSRAIAHKHGLNSIREVPGTKIYFHPPEHEEDLFAAIRRTATEIRRLNLLYPEYAHLETEFSAARPKNVTKTYAGIDIESLELEYWKKVENELDAAAPITFLTNDLWITACTTKKPFASKIATELLPKNANVPSDKITGVLVVPFTNEGRVVAVKHIKRGWDLPGGHLEVMDKRIMDAARREAYEEAKIRLRLLKKSNAIKFCGVIPELDGYMIVVAGLVNRIDEFKANDEIIAREILKTEDFIARYVSGDKSQITAILANAKAEISAAPDILISI